MKNKKRIVTAASLSTMLLFLAACGRKTAQGVMTAPTHGPYAWLYNVLGHPMQRLLEWFAGVLGGAGTAYGIAILVFTIIIRLILMPSMLKNQRKMTEQQEKAKILKPQLDLLQKAAKLSSDQNDTMRINGLMQDVYKKNGSSMIPSMGCLTLIIQLPILSGLYQAVAYSKEMSASTFFGIQLGKPSIVITIVATIFYAIQAWMSLQSATPDQRKSMSTMMWVGPIMTFWISMISSAGLGLYFLGTGIIMVVQQAIISYAIVPSIRKRLDAEYEKEPPVIVVSPDMFDEDGRITDRAPVASSFAQMQGFAAGNEAASDGETSSSESATPTADDLRARNKGKQHRE
ncbi:membrane protein insertase YidC [Lacticaseibacillus songhuajiangensis]|jgi:YidC/Oxa1 family membrane protein insertase|uniref:membrane protein insertase YidC n=1 Tax=Lacticaseibacillus songhuajiangensis TaxID=1296539 RepID=UPI000F782684|nr:membrane protein insertase YidC [Lacticaseibacillus songhuajiangensis]